MTAADLITETQLLATVVEMAEAHGWLVYHQLDQGGVDESGRPWHGKRIGPGFPDLVLVPPARPDSYSEVLFRELKSQVGRLSPDQRLWRNRLIDAGENWAIWRPSDMDLIEETLSGRR